MGWLTKKEFDKTYDSLWKILEDYKIRCMCDNIFECEDLNHKYDINDKTYWIYAHCSVCEYDYNQNKILRQYENIRRKN